MKPRILAILAISLLVTVAADLVEQPAPTDSTTARGLTLADAVLVPRTDFRLAFMDSDTLRVRVAAGMCVVDARYGGGRRAKTVYVGRGLPIDEVLKASTGTAWTGDPQVRLISRDQILQSPMPDTSAPAHPSMGDFLKQVVSPGDIVVVARRT